MKAIFNRDCEVEVVIGLGSDSQPIFEPEIFRKGDEIDFDLNGHPDKFNGEKFVPDTNLWNIQFGDGTMGMGLSREWFDITEA